MEGWKGNRRIEGDWKKGFDYEPEITKEEGKESEEERNISEEEGGIFLAENVM